MYTNTRQIMILENLILKYLLTNFMSYKYLVALPTTRIHLPDVT